jgi:hypothetical protein
MGRLWDTVSVHGCTYVGTGMMMVWLVLYGEMNGELGLQARAPFSTAYNMTRLSCPISFFLLSTTSNMDASDLVALSSQVTMPHNVFDGRNYPTYSPNGGVFVI